MDGSPYFSTWGPLDGPIRRREQPPAIGVILEPDAPPMPRGIAFEVGHAPHFRGPVVTWRLAIGKAEIPGRWVCDRRRFGPLAEWEEREAIRDGGD